MFGQSKIFPDSPSFVIPRLDLILSLISYGVLLEKLMADLAGMIACPDAASYLVITFSSNFTLLGLISVKNIVSSTKRRWFIFGHPLATCNPTNVLRRCAAAQNSDKTSLHSLKR